MQGNDEIEDMDTSEILEIEEIEDMDTLDAPWCWYYLADCGRWHRFEVNCFGHFIYYRIKMYIEQNEL